MYRQPFRFDSPAAGRGQPQQQQQLPHLFPNDHNRNFNFPFQTPHGFFPAHQSLNFPMQNPSSSFQNHGFPLPQFANSGFQPHSSAPTSMEVLARVNHDVFKAHNDLLTAKESVSVFKVLQSALSTLQVDSLNVLGLRMQEIDALCRLTTVEERINSFIHCFVGVRSITSLYELEKAICKNEGIKQFEDLRLGPFLRHPVVLEYFSVNSEMTEIFKISSLKIIHYLSDFMDGGGCRDKDIRVEDFLDFISRKLSITKKGMLGIRVQNLGMLISFIEEARRSEKETLSIYLEKSALKRKNRPLFLSQKQRLDERFSAISQRVESFSSSHKDFCGKHVKFGASSSEDEDTNVSMENEKNCNEKNCNDSSFQLNFSSQSNKSSERASTCPYPSANEEMTRLGIKGEVGGHAAPSGCQKHNQVKGTSKRKRKSRYQSNNISESPTQRKRVKVEANIPNEVSSNHSDEVSNNSGIEYNIANNSLRMFITTWKDACRDMTVAEVLNRMLVHYDLKKRVRTRVEHAFSFYPFIGLLNVAVSSIKYGMWDSIYDALQTFNQQELTDTSLVKQSVYECIDVGPSTKGALVANNVAEHTQSITVEDIINKLEKYIKLEHEIHNNGRILSGNGFLFLFLNQLCSCELWLAEQFSVKDFRSLGHGDLFTFLQKNGSMLSDDLCKFLMPVKSKSFSLQACMVHRQLVALVSQACNHFSEDEIISKQMICTLLARQFPSVGFKLTENGSLEDFIQLVQQHKSSVVSKCVLFSVTLLGKCHVTGSLATAEDELLNTTSVTDDVGQSLRAIGHVSSEDAVKVLVRAPMLLDLNLWSHWNILFAPALGPLVPWLQNEVNTNDFLCMVTREGKVLRLDHTATVDSFLEAALQGSAFQTAVELLSVFALVGGEKHVPLSLLKHHANRAFEVILKNSIESMEVFKNQSQVHEKVFCHQHILEEKDGNLSCELKKRIGSMNKAIPILSRFVVDCLGYLPAEFCPLAADILLFGMRSVIKDAASAILRECHKTEQRVMIHEIGLSLGVVEWIEDSHKISTCTSSDLLSDESACLNDGKTLIDSRLLMEGSLMKHSASEKNVSLFPAENTHNGKMIASSSTVEALEPDESKDAAQIIQSIRWDEFGLDPNLPNTESSMLKKQHARLGRALHCLSQELYSQDSHFLLELVQNADDNIYPQNVEPTLAFIFEETGIVVLNNEEGFSAKNIKALCDVGNSTKKGSQAGYIGKKGIGFKSVFRVTDAPEIHSNGFHIKFDISEGQIGFVLPTIIPPCNVDLYSRLASSASDQQGKNPWRTCIVLPFRSRLSEGAVINNIMSMFSDLHPSLLLFLHRLQCIKLRNLIDDSLIIMRREIVGNGIIKVSRGEEKMTWLVVSQKLRADVVRHDVQSTEISIAFTLQEEENGDYSPYLNQQPVFAFLPLRMYGLKFIIQGDFVLPSSREEVDGDSPWNQWLLSEFPGLFVTAVKSFCSLPCFERCPGKAIAAYMSYIPLIGDVYGFFSSLPRLIISKLRKSTCLLLEGKENEWVPPCKVLRGWNEQARILLPDHLLHEHLGLGFLDKNIVLTDSLARAFGIEEYGPKILVQFISSICQKNNGLKSMGLVWLGSCLNVIYNMLFQSSGKAASELESHTDLLRTLQKVSLVPLSDGTYSSIDEGMIWLHSDSSSKTVDGKHGLEAFPILNAKIRVVCPAFLSLFSVDDSHMHIPSVGNISRMLHRIGVQRLSAHEIIKVHIIPAMSDELSSDGDKTLMTEYICFVMTHLLSSCPECHAEKEFIMAELQNKALILTNHGFKRPTEVPVHFGKEYGNPINIDRFVNILEMDWHVVDVTYLKHPVTDSLSSGLTKWRNFFQEIGVTDFFQIVEVNKSIADVSHIITENGLEPELGSPDSMVKDWESPELSHLLALLSIDGDQESCKYLLEVLDSLWDDHLSDKVEGHCVSKSGGTSKTFKSSFISSICDVQWVVSSVDDGLHYPKDLFYDCDAVRSVLGASVPYAIPKVRSAKFVCDIGFKTRVTLEDILDILKVWRTQIPFKTSISQMCSFYTFLWDQMAASKQKIWEEFQQGPFIFVPFVSGSRLEDVVAGVFLSSKEVYWHDPIGLIDQIKDLHFQCSSTIMVDHPIFHTLSNIYSGCKKFFVHECGILEHPSLCSYLQILKELSTVALPSQVTDTVFQVFLKWADGLKLGLLSGEDMAYLKECLRSSEFMVLPTERNKWVSLHPSFGIVCCCDDKTLRKQFKHMEKINFVQFGENSNDETQILGTKFSSLLKALGVPLLSEIVTREADYHGLRDCRFKTSLMNWALPFAQRYVYSLHPDRYAELKQSEFDMVGCLQIIVVEKLFFRNVLKNFECASDVRVQCSCLLQDNVLYTTQDSDPHSLFMEFSCVLFNGVPELHLANFLHMITAMVESGSTEEQTEAFILNTQRVTKLPENEPIWSITSASLVETSPNTVQSNDQYSKTEAQNWPPVGWKTAPGFRYAREHGFKTQPASSLPHNNHPYEKDEFEAMDDQAENLVPFSADAEWTVEVAPSAISMASIDSFSSGYTEHHLSQGNIDSETAGSQSDSRNISRRIQLRTGTPNPMQAMVTGRLGEQVAFKFFTEKLSSTGAVVEWVNGEKETGLPFDIIIATAENNREYIEVKSTRSARKDWFDISVREWLYAVEKGESYSIAHVILSQNNVAQVSVFKNPVKLCQLSRLQLAVLMPKQQKGCSIISS